MIVVKLKGGLGNQMFQYAFGRAMSLKYDTPLILDASLYSSKNFGTDTPREYKLSNFNISAEVSFRPVGHQGVISNSRILGKLQSRIQKLGIPFFNIICEKGQKFEEPTFRPPSTYYIGYFQSEKYFSSFESEIRNSFRIKNPTGKSFNEFEGKIKSVNSVSIHIRRGDYVTHPGSLKTVGLTPISYYIDAISVIENKYPDCVFFIFSDDIAWAKENLKGNHEMIFVSNPNLQDYEEMILMSQCKHNIISNSTFSWWGAWLNQNKNKVVIRPKKWFADPSLSSEDLLPEDWIAI